MNGSTNSSSSKTDWERIDAMADEDIDLSGCPEATADMFANAVVRSGLASSQPASKATLKIDRDVVEWFKKQEQGYQD